MNSRSPKRRREPIKLKLSMCGAPGVGKSALTVRFLTRRFIGEYVVGKTYYQEMDFDSETIALYVIDRKTENLFDVPMKKAHDSPDGIVLVYSVTERDSFNYVKRVQEMLMPPMPLLLIGNKADMINLRQVSQEEGEILAEEYDCVFVELSAAEQVEEVVSVFTEFCRKILLQRGGSSHSNKQNIFNRMLGTKPNRHYRRGKSDSALPKT